MGAVSCGAASRPVPGFRDNGDAYLVDERDGVWFGALIDGLGHGIEAAAAAEKAREQLAREWPLGPDQALRGCDAVLQGTRGAVVGAVWARLEDERLTYVGVGNIEGLISGVMGTQRLTSIGGFLGAGSFRLHPVEYAFGAGDILIMHSDGVSARFDLAAYPGLLAQEPDLIAGLLLRDWGRASDDATVLVARCEGHPRGII